MEYTTIKANVVDQALSLSNVPLLASGSRKVVQIEFSFCPLWAGMTKTAVFYRNMEDVYHVLVVANKAIVPPEVLAEEGTFFLGVFGTNEEQTRPTEVLELTLKQGALTAQTAVSDPTPDIYEQLLQRISDFAYDAVATRLEPQLAVERARIDNLVQMRPAGGTTVYTPSVATLPGTITTNGAAAFVQITPTLTIAAGTSHEWYIPKYLAPMVPVTIPYPVDGVTMTIYTEAETGRPKLSIFSRDGGKLENSVAEGSYSLASITLTEIEDARVGHDGRIYSNTGTAIRNQIRPLAEAVELETFSENKFDNQYDLDHAALDDDGNVEQNAEYNWRVASKFYDLGPDEFNEGVVISTGSYTPDSSNMPYRIAFYDDEKRLRHITALDEIEYRLPSSLGARYFRVMAASTFDQQLYIGRRVNWSEDSAEEPNYTFEQRIKAKALHVRIIGWNEDGTRVVNHRSAEIYYRSREGYRVFLHWVDDVVIPLAYSTSDCARFEDTQATASGLYFCSMEVDNSGILKVTEKNTMTEVVEAICPAFSQKGNVVRCEPVKGYPINIKSWLAPNTAGDGTPIPLDDFMVSMTLHGKNIYNAAAYPFTEGRYVASSSGKLTQYSASSNYAATEDFIYVGHLRGQYITLNHPPVELGGSQPSMAFYTGPAESGFISGACTNAHTAKVPDDALYMRFSVPKKYADGSQIQIEVGTVVTAFEAYREPEEFSQELWPPNSPVYVGRFDWNTGHLYSTHDLVDGELVEKASPELVDIYDLEAVVITARGGSYVIYSDTGDTEVSGHTDPVALIDILTRRLDSIAGTTAMTGGAAL